MGSDGRARCNYCAAIVSRPAVQRAVLASAHFATKSLGGFTWEPRGAEWGVRYDWRAADGALVVTAPASESTGFPLLLHRGVFDDVEACVRFQIEDGLDPQSSVALWMVVDDEVGAYTVRLYADGRLTVALRDPVAVIRTLVELDVGDVLSGGRPVELRASLLGDKMRLYVNGAVVGSIRCCDLTQGYFILGVETWNRPLTVALSALELSDPSV